MDIDKVVLYLVHKQVGLGPWTGLDIETARLIYEKRLKC